MSLAKQPDKWRQACLVAELLLANQSLPGAIIKSRAGAVREAFLDLIKSNAKRVHANISIEALTGGIDLTSTLSTGKVVFSNGLLQPGATLLVAMAERLPPQTAAILAQALDADPTLRLILLDEGIEDERAPDCLSERLPFYVDLEGIGQAQTQEEYIFRTRKCDTFQTDDHFGSIANITAALGVPGARAPYFALKTASTLAALSGRSEPNEDDIQNACLLTLAHKATRLPQAEQETEQENPPEQEALETGDEDKMPNEIPEDLLLEAVLAALPPDILAKLSKGTNKKLSGSGSGTKTKGNRRGRPLPALAAKPNSDQRIDLFATLRAAAPWQTIRRSQSGQGGIHVRASDLRVKRYEDRSDRLVIFAVDASGSSAISRLAEAKGAIELLLGDAYARRDHVALVAFRGTSAEILLPPTRSLVQTKRRLAELPGGGGTPLASGMEAALELALGAQRRGMAPTVCILTDGRANIDKTGNANRIQAMADAESMGQLFVSCGVDSLIIDTGVRPERKLKDLADVMRAPYIPMPRADAKRLSQTIEAAV